ncbi:MAG: ribosome maturation factor RimM [Butyrivibrio sp.]
MEDLLRVGVITSTHGIAGEVKVFPTTDDPNRFKKLKKCILKTERETLELDISGVKFFKNMVILKFKQFTNINEVEKFRNGELFVTRDNAVPLEEGEYFVCDLIGLKVQDEDSNFIGVISDVLQTAANDVYEVTSNEGRKYLIPAIKQCILKVDIDNGIMSIHAMKGLLDL